MKFDFWKERWDARQIGFHQPKTNAHLQKYLEKMRSDFGERVFVPLAGKTGDIMYLLKHNCKVVAVEFVNSAIEEFFEENKLEYSRASENHYQAANLDFYCMDVLTEKAPWKGRFDWIYDRAALVALDPSTRKEYARKISDAAKEGTGYLLITFDYNKEAHQGPPFAVSEQEVRQLFSNCWEIEKVDTVDLMKKSPFARNNPSAKFFTEEVFILGKSHT